jgi:tetratricopeptide (TPR) repeat protein
MTIQEAINVGLSHQQAGRLREAEAIYRQVLAQVPGQPEVVHLLGVLAQQAGNPKAAVELISSAIAAVPGRADFHGNLGMAYMDLGQADAAIAEYQKSIAINPGLQQAHNNLGNALTAAGRMEPALAAFDRALAIAPDYVDPLYNKANTLKAMGRLDEAVILYEQALVRRPNWVEALNNLGVAHKLRTEYSRACECFQRALKVAPNFVMAWSNLGDAFCELAQYEESVTACQRALQLQPNLPEALNNLGHALVGLGRYDEAIQCFRAAVGRKPEYAEAYNNMAGAYLAKGDLEQSMCYFKTAIALKPDYPTARWNTGLIHLMRGEYEEGFKEYEWRLRLPLKQTRTFKAPRWDGGDLNGRRILIETDQAFGDTFQFFRYVPLVAQRGGKVIVACQKDLLELLKIQGGIEEYVDVATENLPDFDVQIPMPSLALAFGTTLETIPAQVPYIVADSSRVAHWKSRVEEAAPGRRKVGLVWVGRSYPDPFRATTLAELSAVGSVAGNWFCSLQKGEGAGQKLPDGFGMTDWTSELTNFTETAALMSCLDLIITIDTSVAHLAGAMGKPVWILLKTVPDWRWMLGRSDCPWYPTARLFRQDKFRDWSKPIAEIVAALRAL